MSRTLQLQKFLRSDDAQPHKPPEQLRVAFSRPLDVPLVRLKFDLSVLAERWLLGGLAHPNQRRLLAVLGPEQKRSLQDEQPGLHKEFGSLCT